MFSREIQRIRMKFGTEVVLERGRILGGGGFQPNTPTPGCGVRKGGPRCLWNLSCAFWQKLYKTKVAGPPDLMGAGHLLDPKFGSGRTWIPCPSGTMVTHYEGEFIKSKLYDMSLIAIWWGLTPPTFTPGSRGPKRGARCASGAVVHHF